MKINVGDYLILSHLGKPALAKCTHAEEKEYSAKLERNRSADDKDSNVDFKFADVLSNLGKRPKFGSVHGVKIEPLISREASPSQMWQDIRIYQFWDAEQLDAFKSELSTTTKKLRSLGLGVLRCELEVRQPSGKQTGFYKFRSKAETDILCIKPQENLESFRYIVAHESATGVWSRMMLPKIRIKWIQLYHEYITFQEVLEEELTAILEDILSATSIKDYLKETDEAGTKIVKDALRHIQRVHGLSRHHLELALNNGEDITTYWPTALELSSKEEAISELSTRSPEKFFAEAFAFHVCEKKIPRKIQALLDITMTKLKRA